MDSMQMSNTMAQQQYHLHQMPFRPSGPGSSMVMLGGQCLDLNNGHQLTSSPFPDFQLAELHHTLENLINSTAANSSPDNSTGPGGQYNNNRIPTSATNDLPYLPFEQSDLCRYPPQMLPNNGNNSNSHNSNKRMSVDLGCSLSDYSESWSTNSPRSSASSEESTEGKPLQVQLPNPKSACNLNSIYPNNVKRQNIGRMSSARSLNGNNAQPKLLPNMIQQNISMRHQQQGGQQPMLIPPVAQFVGRPRLFDVSTVGHRPQLYHHNIRSPMLPNQPQLQSGQRMPPLMIPQSIRHQTTFNYSPDQPSTAAAVAAEAAHQTEKRTRFMRTAQILEQSGLMDVTLKTAQLMRENANLQREIDVLMAETRNIEQQFLATRHNNMYQFHQQQNQSHQQQAVQFHPDFQSQQENIGVQYVVGPNNNNGQQMNGQSNASMQSRGSAPLQQHLLLEY